MAGRLRCRITASVSPNVALPGQKITYTAIFLSFDNQAPTRAEVDIDGAKYPMVLQGGTPKTGMTYTYTTKSLGIADHYHRFVFNDETGAAYYESSSRPSITPLVLANSSAGKNSSTYTFQTTYTEISGQAPTSAVVYVDNKQYPMTYISACSSYTNALFQAQITLSGGCKNYDFVFVDNNAKPASGWADPFNPVTYKCPSAAVHAQPVQPGVLLVPENDVDPDIPMGTDPGTNQL